MAEVDTRDDNRWLVSTITNHTGKCHFREWLRCMPKECISALDVIYDRLYDLYSKKEKVYPQFSNIMLPFTKMSPDNLKFLIIGLEPYKDGTATGIPAVSFNIRDGRYVMTPTARAFKSVATRILGLDSSNKEFMDPFYNNGILVLNASFTAETVVDKRYELSHEHRTLWARFMYPFLRYCRDRDVFILCLGKGAYDLHKAIEGYDKLYYARFPTDAETTQEFEQMVKDIVDSINEAY